jgi:hypothetical protein
MISGGELARVVDGSGLKNRTRRDTLARVRIPHSPPFEAATSLAEGGNGSLAGKWITTLAGRYQASHISICVYNRSARDRVSPAKAGDSG